MANEQYPHYGYPPATNALPAGTQLASAVASGTVAASAAAAQPQPLDEFSQLLHAFELLRNASLPELLESANCGELNVIACLCSPVMRDIARAVDARFAIREQDVIFRKICNSCAPRPTLPTGDTTVISTPGVPSMPGTAPPLSKPVPSSPPCSPQIPPQGSVTP